MKNVFDRIKHVASRVQNGKTHGKNKRVLRFLAVTLASVVVFTTIYGLILPAITIDQETAEKEPGFDPVLSESVEIPAEDPVISDAPVPENSSSEPAAAVALAGDISTETETQAAAETETSADPETQAAASEASEEATSASEAGEAVPSESVVSEDTETQSAEAAAEDITVEKIPEAGYGYLSGTFTAEEENDYLITAVVTEDAKIPASAEFVVSEIKEEDEEYQTYVDQAIEALGGESLIFARFFDIRFELNGEEIEPASPIEVSIQYAEPVEAAEDQLAGLHFHEEEKPAVLELEVKGEENAVEEVKFGTEGFSVFGVVAQKEITTQYITAEGETYTITVTYDENAGIPEGAVLAASEILPGDSNYDTFVEDSAAAVFCEVENIQHIRVFDISILSAEGDIIEPLTSVKVAIIYDTPAQIENATDISMVHFTESALEVIEAKTNINESGTLDEVRFNADSFSAYAIVSTATNNLNGMSFAIVNNYTHDAVQDTLLAGNNNRLNKIRVTVNNDGDVAVTGNATEEISAWTFTRVNNTNQYYISNKSGEYININGNSVTLSNTRQALTVTAGTGGRSGRVRISRNGNALNDYDNGLLSSGIGGYNDNGNNEWFTLYELGQIQTTRPDITVHYVDKAGNKLADDKNLADTTKVDGTENYTDPYIYGEIHDLYQKIDGYAYQSTHLGSINGTQINAEVVYNYGDSWSTYNTGDEYPHTDNSNNYAPLHTASYQWQYQEPNRDHGTNVTNYDLQGFGNTKDVYVVYEEGEEVIPTHGSSDDGIDEHLDEPKPVKTLDTNHDGTYKMSLSVNASSKEVSKSNGANIILIFDMSWSMQNNNISDGRTRLEAAKAAAKDLATRLLNINSGRTTPLVEMNVIPFNASVQSPSDWLTQAGSNSSTDTNRINGFINGLDASNVGGGTNWEAALEAAKTAADDHKDGDDTYVIFMTDGNPWMSDMPSNHDTYLRDFFEKGAYFYATEPARQIVKAGYELYGVGIYGNVDVLHLLLNFAYNGRSTYDPTTNAYGHFFLAQNQAVLIQALSDIAGSIEGKLAMAGVELKDGIAISTETKQDTTMTALKSTSVNVGGTSVPVLSSVTYSKSKGTAEDSKAFSVTVDAAGNAVFTIDGSTHNASIVNKTYDEIVNTGTVQNPEYTTQNAQAYVYSVTVSGKTYEMAVGSLNAAGDLDWNLSPLGTLEDGATYTISTTVWPNQEAYNLVSELNNGTATWDASKQQAKRDKNGNVLFYYGGASKNGTTYEHIVKYPNNTYAALSNTYQTLDYYVVTEEDGSISYEKGPTISMPFPDPMKLTDNTITLKKEWEKNMMPGATIPDEVTLNLLRRGNGSFETFIEGIELKKDEGWSTTKYIAPGLMISKTQADARGISGTVVTYNNSPYVILNDGYDYMFTEGFQQNFELEEKIYHPMLIDSDSTLTDVEFVRNEQGVITEVKATGNNISQGLTAINHLKGGININKVVQDVQRNVINNSSEIFDVNVTMNVPKKEDGSPDPDFSNVDKYYNADRTELLDNSVAWYAYYDAQGNRLYDDDLIELGILTDSGDTYTWTDGHNFEHTSRIGEGVNHPRDRFDNYGSGYFMIDFDNKTGIATGKVKVIPGYTARFTNMAAGTTYSVLETSESAAGYLVSYSYTHQAYYDGQPVGDPVPDLTDTHVVVVNQANNVTVNNRKTKSQLIIIKADEKGTAITSADDTAQFSIQKNTADDGSGQWVNAQDVDDNPRKIVDGIVTINTTEGVELKGLETGLYRLTETKAPDGYVILSGAVTFRLADDVITFVSITETPDPEDETKKTYTVKQIDPPEGYTITAKGQNVPTTKLTIKNTPGQALPNTGGSGRLPYLFVGLGLLLGASVILILRRRLMQKAA